MVLGPPSDDDVPAVLHRVLRQAQRDWADEGASWADDECEARLRRLDDGHAQERSHLSLTAEASCGGSSPCCLRRAPDELSWSLGPNASLRPEEEDEAAPRLGHAEVHESFSR